MLDFRNVVMVKIRIFPEVLKCSFYDRFVAKYLNKIKDPGYMKYKALADKLKENKESLLVGIPHGHRRIKNQNITH